MSLCTYVCRFCLRMYFARSLFLYVCIRFFMYACLFYLVIERFISWCIVSFSRSLVLSLLSSIGSVAIYMVRYSCRAFFLSFSLRYFFISFVIYVCSLFMCFVRSFFSCLFLVCGSYVRAFITCLVIGRSLIRYLFMYEVRCFFRGSLVCMGRCCSMALCRYWFLYVFISFGISFVRYRFLCVLITLVICYVR